MAYELSDAALADLDRLHSEGVAGFGPDKADEYLLALFDVFDLLSRFPQMVRVHAASSSGVRVHPHGRHVVLYRAAGDSVTVIRVRYGREDWVAGLREGP